MSDSPIALSPRGGPSFAGAASAHRRGTILIVVMVVLFALASLVLALGRDARTDSSLAANLASAAEADMIERGAEQYVLALLEGQKDTLASLGEESFANVPVGRGAFWIVRPTYGDTNQSGYGLVDECSKVNLNTVTYDSLMQMPGMLDQIAGSIVDWRDDDDTPTGTGSESAAYGGTAEPYRAKNGPFESVEELNLLGGVTEEFLHGTDAAQNDTSTLGSAFNMDYVRTGYFDRFTCWGLAEAQSTGGTGGATTSTLAARVNINTAPKEVLMSLPGMVEANADAMIAARATSVNSSNPTDTSWATPYLGGGNQVQNQITGQGAYFSADIVAVGGGGRAFRRVKIVVATSPSLKVVYRRDVTDRGLPPGSDFLQQMRESGATR